MVGRVAEGTDRQTDRCPRKQVFRRETRYLNTRKPPHSGQCSRAPNAKQSATVSISYDNKSQLNAVRGKRQETDIVFTGRNLLFIVFEQFLENIVWYFFSQRILEFPEKFTLLLQRERERERLARHCFSSHRTFFSRVSSP